MYDLEKSISNWRKQMRAAGIKSPAPLEELECHLRDEIEQQMNLGLDAQHAFESAVQKTGQVYMLKTEFAKVGGVGKITKWERWFAGFILLAAIIPLGTYTLLKNDMSAGWRLAGLADIAVITLAVLGCRWINRAFPVIPDSHVRMAIGITFGLMSMAGVISFAKCILPNFELTVGQLTVVVLWALTVMAALGTVWAGLEEAARRQTATSD